MRVLDPYACGGQDRKAQLHCHTTASDGQYAAEAVVARYRSCGFSFVALTDHDRLSDTTGLSDHEVCVVSGVEVTVPRPVHPLGPHVGCLAVSRVPRSRKPEDVFAEVEAAGGVAGLNHPSWTGNLWTARWRASEVRRLRGVRFVEVWNPHSDPDADTQVWVEAVRAHGPAYPVSPVAADDFHRDAQFGRAWTVVRTEALDAGALVEALRRGSVYATTGPQARFAVRDGAVVVESDAAVVRFFDAAGRLRLEVPRGMAEYEPGRADGFVRAECLGRSAGRAWSAAFWVLDDFAAFSDS